MKKMHYGYTLVEVAISSVIASIVIASFSFFAVYYFQSYQFSFDESVAITHAESTLRQITKEIRETRAANNGSYPLVTTGDQELTFYGDIDNDGDAEQIRYFLDGISFKRGIIEPTGIPAQYPEEDESIHIIADYMRNGTDPVFYYYNEDWPGDIENNPLDPESRLLNTRLITVFLRVTVNEEADPGPFELSSSIQLRNLKSNL